MWQPPAHYPYPPYPGMPQGGAAGGGVPFPNFGYPYPYMYPHPGMGVAKSNEPMKKKRGRPSKRKKRNKQAKAEVFFFLPSPPSMACGSTFPADSFLLYFLPPSLWHTLSQSCWGCCMQIGAMIRASLGLYVFYRLVVCSRLLCREHPKGLQRPSLCSPINIGKRSKRRIHN